MFIGNGYSYSYLAQVDLFNAFGVNSHLECHQKYNSKLILVFIKFLAGYTSTHDSGLNTQSTLIMANS